MATPNDHESKAYVTVIAVSVCLSVTTIIVALRVYTRAFILKQFGMDDYAAVISLSTVIACGLAIVLSVDHGAGKHIWTLSPEDIAAYLRNFYLSIVFYNASILATKAAFLLQYYRVLAINKKMRLIFFWSLVVIGSWCTAFVLIAIFQCTPIPDFWMKSPADPTRKCIPNLPYWHVQGGGHIATDIAVFCLPLPTLIQLKVNRVQKISLIGVFSLGFFTCAISIIRLPYLRVSPDLTWDNVVPSSWSIGEISAGLVCACLPSLRPLLGKLAPGLASSLSGNGRTGGGPSYLKQASGADRSAAHHGTSRQKTMDSSRTGGHSRSQSSVERLNNDSGEDLEMGGIGGEKRQYKHTHARAHPRSGDTFFDDRVDETGQPEAHPRSFPDDDKKSEATGFGLRGVVVTEVSVGNDRRPPIPNKDRSSSQAAGRIQVVRDIVYHAETK